MLTVLTPSLDAFITERDTLGNHIEGESCDFRLGNGDPLSKKKCSTCTRLSALVNLSDSWSQNVDCGRLSGRRIEIVRNIGGKSSKDAETSWKIYREAEAAERAANQCILRRYYASFTCGGDNFCVRDSTTLTSPPDMFIYMLAQILELFSSLPREFTHGNPTVSCISFLPTLPVALRHKKPCIYSSRELIQVDYGGMDTAALRIMSLNKQQVVNEALGAILLDSVRGYITIRREASFFSFLREYPTHARVLSLYFLVRGLLSLYPRSASVVPNIKSSNSKSLREAFEENRGIAIPITLEESLSSLVCATITRTAIEHK